MKNMKIVMMLLIAGSASLAAGAQKLDDSKVPSGVKTSFAKDFPGATTKWEKESPNYEANFKMNGKTMSALYDGSGNRQETETDIKVSDLPASVKNYIAQNYKGAKIKEAAMITKPNGEVNYEAEVKGMDVLFTKEGKFIKTAKD